MHDAVASVTWLTSFKEVTEAYRVKDGFVQASYDAGKELILEDVLIALDGEPHHRRRRLEAPLFNRRLLRVYEGTLIPEIMAQSLARHARDGSVDLVPLSHLITTRLAARVAGIDGHESPEKSEQLRALMVTLHEGAIVGWSKRPFEDVRRDVTQAKRSYHEHFFFPSLERRKRLVEQLNAGKLTAEDLPYDLLTLILIHEAEDHWDLDLMLRETVHYLIAGAHTPATAVVQAIHDLFQWFDAHPEERARVGDLAFLQQAVQETLRANPPSQFQMRRATRRIILGEDRIVEPGEIIGLDLTAANRDPAVFGPDADRFNPNRPVAGKVPRYGYAFSSGAHLCIGKDLATGVYAAAAGQDGAEPTYGILARIVGAFLEHGARPDPSSPPQTNPETKRIQYLTYPVCFAGAGMLRPA